MEFKQFVFSSRQLLDDGNNITYKTKDAPDTSRRDLDDALDHFNFGEYTIKIEEENDAPNLTAEFPLFMTNSDHDEKNHFSDLSKEGFLPGTHTNQIFTKVLTSVKASGKLLYIYLHGFDNDAETERMKQVLPMVTKYYPYQNNLNSPVGEIIFLTWPSQGRLQYKRGENGDISKMATMLAAFMLKLAHFVKNDKNPLFADEWEPKIVFHSQSMGCKILLTAVERLNFLENANTLKKDFLNRFFHRIILTGADIDLDSMKDMEDENGEEIHQLAKRVILFYNKHDRALWISRFVFLSGKRLGRHLNNDTMKDLPKNIDLIEIDGNGEDFYGHNYFSLDNQVATFFKTVLQNSVEDNVALNSGRIYHFNIAENLPTMTEIHIS